MFLPVSFFFLKSSGKLREKRVARKISFFIGTNFIIFCQHQHHPLRLRFYDLFSRKMKKIFNKKFFGLSLVSAAQVSRELLKVFEKFELGNKRKSLRLMHSF